MNVLFFLTSPLLPRGLHHRVAVLRGGRRCCVNSEVMAFTVCTAPSGPHMSSSVFILHTVPRRLFLTELPDIFQSSTLLFLLLNSKKLWRDHTLVVTALY